MPSNLNLAFFTDARQQKFILGSLTPFSKAALKFWASEWHSNLADIQIWH